MAVVNGYFDAMRRGGFGVAELFHPDAQLIGLGTVVSGRDAIRAFYADAIARGGPSPRPGGPMLADGSRVAAEIFIDLADGTVIHAMDLFEVDGGLIRSLTYFIADHP